MLRQRNNRFARDVQTSEAPSPKPAMRSAVEGRKYIQSNDFLRFALEVRLAFQLDLVRHPDDYFAINHATLAGACGEVAVIITEHLITQRVPETTWVFGYFNGENHCWTSAAGMVIDATATQFSPRIPPVFRALEKRATAYDPRERDSTPVGEIPEARKRRIVRQIRRLGRLP